MSRTPFKIIQVKEVARHRWQFLIGLFKFIKRLVPSMIELQRMLWGLGLFFVTFLLGTLGYMAYGWSFSDAVYMIVISVSTVGYGEIQPINTPGLRALTTFIIISGLVGNALVISALAEIIISRGLIKALGRQSVEKTIDSMSEHAVIVGYGKMGRQTVERLIRNGLKLVVIENNPEAIDILESEQIPYIQGDGMNESTLLAAGIERAKYALCLLSNDVDNVFVTLSARQLNSKVRIITKADQQSSLRKLYQAGANHVVSPSSMGSMRVTALVVNPLIVELSEAINTSFGETQVEIHEMPLDEFPEVHDLDFQTIQTRMLGIHAVIVGIRHATGRVSFPPPLDHCLASGDSLIFLGRHEDFPKCTQLFREKVVKDKPPK